MKKKTKAQIEQSKYDRGQIVVKVIAGILALMMLIAGSASALFVLFG